MNEQMAEIVELRHVRPVKWSAVDKRVKPFREGFVATFLKYEGTPLLNEDGSPMMSAGPKQPRQLEVTARSYAKRYGIAQTTFQDWVVRERGITQPWNQRTDTVREFEPSSEDEPQTGRTISMRPTEHHGQCGHCPEWEGE